MLNVFPGSERLRYLIPFAEPQRDDRLSLRESAERHPGAVVVFGDDGEKFGTWPETKQHVYDDGWLRRFFDVAGGEPRLADDVHAGRSGSTACRPLGKIYLPDGSYREMTEWALPVAQQTKLRRRSASTCRTIRAGRSCSDFVRGGFWRNFKVKYPEANEMYARMMTVSRAACMQAEQRGAQTAMLLEQARQELYRGQCNCSYWHGAFGGIYLPHLRNAVYQHLIAADNLLDEAFRQNGALG